MEKMTEKKCLSIGGHCWEMHQQINMGKPPTITRECRHCGKMQIGIPREPVTWRDISPKEAQEMSTPPHMGYE